MTTMLCLIYLSICVVLFRFCRVPLTKWTVTTAAVGGLILIGGVVVFMNYNHPFSRDGRSYFYATPVSPAVNGQVMEVPVVANVPLKKGTSCFGSILDHSSSRSRGERRPWLLRSRPSGNRRQRLVRQPPQCRERRPTATGQRKTMSATRLPTHTAAVSRSRSSGSTICASYIWRPRLA